MVVYRDRRVEVHLNLLPQKWTFILENFRTFWMIPFTSICSDARDCFKISMASSSRSIFPILQPTSFPWMSSRQEELVVIRDHHEPIIDRELWDIVQSELKKPPLPEWPPLQYR